MAKTVKLELELTDESKKLLAKLTKGGGKPAADEEDDVAEADEDEGGDEGGEDEGGEDADGLDGEDEDGGEDDTLSAEDVRAALHAYRDVFDLPKTKALIKQLGKTSKLSEVKPKYFQALYDAATKSDKVKKLLKKKK